MKTSLELLYAGKEQCEPGHAFGPAVRPHYLLHFILEGRGKYQTAQGTFHLREGQAFLIKPGEIAYYAADRREPWRVSEKRKIGSDEYRAAVSGKGL